jgi:hypothetical protein
MCMRTEDFDKHIYVLYYILSAEYLRLNYESAQYNQELGLSRIVGVNSESAQKAILRQLDCKVDLIITYCA